MTEVMLGSALAWTAAVVVLLPVGLLLFSWPLLGITRDLWQLMATLGFRCKRRSYVALAIVSSLLFFVLVLVLGAGHFAGILFLVAVLVPTPALLGISYLEWHAAEPELRQAAAAIRNELAGSLGHRCVAQDRWWRQFVFDAEKARRSIEYRPPPI